jgi:pimeloyl-ACP methyl ester carboxylesterase/DNA-binding CsgD family transcriptional regulator
MARETEIRFLPFAGRRVAYAVTGDGPALVAPAWWISHLELDWSDPAFRAFWESVAEGHTLVRYDRLGVGMSDRDVREEDLTLDSDLALLSTVLDELALDEVTLVGGSSGGCAAIAFAARFPDRVDRLLLYGAYADGPSITSPEVREAIVGTVRSHWGLGSRLLADMFSGDADPAEHERLARYQRDAASPDTAAVLLELIYRNDVRAELGRVRAPTLVVHRRDDRAIPYRLGRELAAGIPTAKLIPLAGNAHFPWAGDSDSVARALRTVLAPEAPPGPPGAAADPPTALLSAREREVLALVASGLSDQEVAEQLVVSRHTVHRHVANIRHKLGRNTRTAAVAEAARLGLL